jgi:hypothetical protein
VAIALAAAPRTLEVPAEVPADRAEVLDAGPSSDDRSAQSMSRYFIWSG